MLGQRIRQALGRSSGKPDPRTYTVILRGVEGDLQTRLYPCRRATILAQGSTTSRFQVAGTGEGATADGGDYVPLVGWTTSTFGAAGGPQAGQNILLLQTHDGSEVAVGYYG